MLFVLLIFNMPFFDGFYRAKLPNPTFGKGGLIWSSLTLALLTLPVVIVATEEALSAVPNSMREGSYACGASKWQTIRRIVLPRAMPGIMTGHDSGDGAGAGEVAPLMLVGAVKLAPELPVDMAFPFVHADRSFMHLGFHIYDLGFQSQNSEAAVPMVYTTTLAIDPDHRRFEHHGRFAAQPPAKKVHCRTVLANRRVKPGGSRVKRPRRSQP